MAPAKKIPGKIDFKKDFKTLYSPSTKEPTVVEVPAFKYIMVDGRGYPGKVPDFPKKMEVMFGLAYTLKFARKGDLKKPLEFAVAPISGFYCADDPACFADETRRSEWKWTLGIPVPDEIDAAAFRKAKETLRARKNPEFLDDVYLKVIKEGLSVQIMHLGPYDKEGPNIRKLHDFMDAQGFTFNGAHNEIYLGDPRRSDPAKLKTIIRQPMKKIPGKKSPAS